MKTLCVVTLALTAALATPVLGETPVAVDDLSWMAGYWTGADDPRYEELWLAPAGGVMVGIGRDARREGRVSFEYLRIEPRADGAYYVAKPSNQPEAAFRLASAGPGPRAVFENPAHDFPQRISYALEGDVLTATVSGIVDGKERSSTFVMKRTPFGKETK